MTTTVNLRKTLDRKEWEMMTPAPSSTAAGTFIMSSGLPVPLQMYVQAATVHFLYRPEEDAWLTLPTGALGTIAAGSCGTYHPNGPTGTATAGGASTLTTNLTIPGNLAGYTIRLTAGPGAGDDRTILSNTYGANAVITVSSPFSATPTGSTTYTLLTGRFYCFCCSALAITFKYYDVATNTWSSALGVSGPSATTGTDGCLVATPGSIASIATGTATSGGATTLTNSGKTWTTNMWTNFQVRITSGLGAGQVRTIVSNTSTVLTVSAWTTNPDSTSVYSIEGNDDFLYFLGNASVTMFRYSISGNTWSTLSPGAARSVAPGAGMSANWVYGATDSTWLVESNSNQGDRIYSFRGAASANLDYYSISQNTWVSTITYQRLGDTFTTGTSYVLINDYLYIQKDATGRFYRFDIPKQTLDPWSTLIYAQGTALVGAKLFDVSYTDGGTTIRWVYSIRNSANELFRCMVI